jgi:hypothetical protein
MCARCDVEILTVLGRVQTGAVARITPSRSIEDVSADRRRRPRGCQSALRRTPRRERFEAGLVCDVRPPRARHASDNPAQSGSRRTTSARSTRPGQSAATIELLGDRGAATRASRGRIGALNNAHACDSRAHDELRNCATERVISDADALSFRSLRADSSVALQPREQRVIARVQEPVKARIPLRKPTSRGAWP